MIYCVKYIVFCLLVLLMIVEWIFQHVQTEIKKKQNKTKQTKQKNRKKNDRLTQNFEVCNTSIRIFQALNVVLESGYSGHSLHIDTQHYFALRQFFKKKKKKKKGKRRRKKKKVVTQTGRVRIAQYFCNDLPHFLNNKAAFEFDILFNNSLLYEGLSTVSAIELLIMFYTCSNIA